MALPPLAQAILDFWFDGEPGSASRENTGTRPQQASRPEWFRKSEAFDARIRERFGTAIAAAVAGAFGEWCGEPRGALARVILLDQFTRNSGRDTPAAFAGDARALATARNAVDRSLDRELGPYERWFLYMPFVHSEGIADQERAVALFRALADQTGLSEPLPWAERHAAVIRRFGRFPHRNAVLGRASTPEELEFLEQPGSRF
ncbi:MAG TPA: DUF924 family protein [Casimicrobiaceae bacterium]|nr:DUF924 family protein [Casimicrobiaceae bacterium]